MKVNCPNCLVAQNLPDKKYSPFQRFRCAHCNSVYTLGSAQKAASRIGAAETASRSFGNGEVDIVCPHCHEELEMDGEMAVGEKLVCPCCGKAFVCSRKKISVSNRKKVSAMVINCPNCGNELKAPDGLVSGQHLVCPYCNQKFSCPPEDGSWAFCTRCGNALNSDDAFCSKCGAATDGADNPQKTNSRQDKFFERIERIELERYERELNKSDKSRVAYIFLGLFLGFLGFHNFYIGRNKNGIWQLLSSTIGGVLTFGLALPLVAIWVLVEICTITKDVNGKILS